MRARSQCLVLSRLEIEILEILKVIDKPIKNQVNVLMGLIREKTVVIPRETKIEVYENADKRCECCGRPLKMKHGDFHVTKETTWKTESSTIQLLCPTCHRIYGHTIKKGQMQSHKVPQHESPYWERKRTPRSAEHRFRSPN